MRRDVCKYCGNKIGVNQRSAASSHGFMHANQARKIIASLAKRSDSELLSVFREIKVTADKLGRMRLQQSMRMRGTGGRRNSTLPPSTLGS